MSKNLNVLLAKREALEKQILAVQELEKRKKRVHQIVFGVLKKHPGAARDAGPWYGTGCETRSPYPDPAFHPRITGATSKAITNTWDMSSWLHHAV
jgi:hypothetical protein